MISCFANGTLTLMMVEERIGCRPVRVSKCSESNTWGLTRKDNVLVCELIDGEPSMSKGVVERVGSHNN